MEPAHWPRSPSKSAPFTLSAKLRIWLAASGWNPPFFLEIRANQRPTPSLNESTFESRSKFDKQVVRVDKLPVLAQESALHSLMCCVQASIEALLDLAQQRSPGWKAHTPPRMRVA